MKMIKEYLGYTYIYDNKSKTYFVTFHFQVNEAEKCEIKYHLCEDAFTSCVKTIDTILKQDLRYIPMIARMYNVLKEFDYK